MSKISAEAPSEPTCVLLVEDNSILVLGIIEVLSPPLFEVTAVPELAKASSELKNGKFDVIILDLHLPDSWSSFTVESLPDEADDLPIIVLSGSRIDLEKLAGNAERFSALLEKGIFDIRLLPSIVTNAVNNFRQRQLVQAPVLISGDYTNGPNS